MAKTLKYNNMRVQVTGLAVIFLLWKLFENFVSVKTIIMVFILYWFIGVEDQTKFINKNWRLLLLIVKVVVLK